MRAFLSIWLIVFAVPAYVATTKYVPFASWSSFLLLSICSVAVWYSGMLMMRHIDASKIRQLESLKRRDSTNLEVFRSGDRREPAKAAK